MRCVIRLFERFRHAALRSDAFRPRYVGKSRSRRREIAIRLNAWKMKPIWDANPRALAADRRATAHGERVLTVRRGTESKRERRRRLHAPKGREGHLLAGWSEVNVLQRVVPTVRIETCGCLAMIEGFSLGSEWRRIRDRNGEVEGEGGEFLLDAHAMVRVPRDMSEMIHALRRPVH